MSVITGNPVFDAIGTLMIGTLLILVAITLGIETKSLLVGEGATEADHDRIVDAINDDGYLTDPIDEICRNMLPEVECTPAEVERILVEQVQKLDPLGVGARSVGECIALQLNQLEPETPGLQLALTLASHHLDQVAAQQTLQAGEKERARLTRMRYEAGTASLLDLLDSERSLAAADQALVQARLGELLNRLALYKALGGEERVVS